MIGCLLGHSEVQTTERYAHLAAGWVKESAVRISESIAADILPGYAAVVTPALVDSRVHITEEGNSEPEKPY